MSLTFTLTGTVSTLTTTFFPTISLEGEWEVGLLNFESYNSIPNITKGSIYVKELEGHANLWNSHGKELSNTEKYELMWANFEKTTVPLKVMGKEKKRKVQYVQKRVDIPTGSYEIDDIARYVNHELDYDAIAVKLDRNALKTMIKAKVYDVMVSADIADILGFGTGRPVTEDDPPLWVPARTKKFSPFVPRISKVNILRILCNLAYGSYINDKPTHSLHEFHPNVGVGYKISEVPRNVIYFPINSSVLSSLTLNVVDQLNQLVDFRGEEITIRIHLRKKS